MANATTQQVMRCRQRGCKNELARLVAVAPIALAKTPMTGLFVIGTLKRGFPNHHYLDGATFLGCYHTCEPYPLIVAGPWYAPMMFDQPGTGEIIQGELYELDSSILARIDQLESIGVPGNFRIELRVRGGPEQRAMAYVKSPELARPVHSGFLSDYQDRRFIPVDKRQPVGNPDDRSYEAKR